MAIWEWLPGHGKVRLQVALEFTYYTYSRHFRGEQSKGMQLQLAVESRILPLVSERGYGLPTQAIALQPFWEWVGSQICDNWPNDQQIIFRNFKTYVFWKIVTG